MTLNELSKGFRTNYMEIRLRPSTVRGYSVNLDLHILPVLGTRELPELTVDDLDRLTIDLRERHGLSNKSIVYVHATLRKMLNYAIKRGYLEVNPYRAFDLPKIERYRYSVLSDAECRRMLRVVCGHPILELPVKLALCYGLRRGEILGIQPDLDVDFSRSVLLVQRTRSVEHGKNVLTPCKTEHGYREILLAPEHLKLIRYYHRINNCAYLVPITPSKLDTTFQGFLYMNHFKPMRFHDLRHSYATVMLAKGVNPKIVSSVLGHSDVSVTLDIYSHPDVMMQFVCLDVFNKLGDI